MKSSQQQFTKILIICVCGVILIFDILYFVAPWKSQNVQMGSTTIKEHGSGRVTTTTTTNSNNYYNDNNGSIYYKSLDFVNEIKNITSSQVQRIKDQLQTQRTIASSTNHSTNAPPTLPFEDNQTQQEHQLQPHPPQKPKSISSLSALELSQLVQSEINYRLDFSISEEEKNSLQIHPGEKVGHILRIKQEFFQQYANEIPDGWPPFEKVQEEMKSTNKTAGQHALDFAILGFPKCGTSTMMFWLGEHAEISIPGREIRILQGKKPQDLVRLMYTAFPPSKVGPNVKRGYKSPADMENLRVRNLLNGFFPNTKLIVGIRHPILWFQSFYNFRVQNGSILAPLSKFQTKCTNTQGGVCADRGNFHAFLATYGKTPMTEHERNTSFSLKHQKLFQEIPIPNTKNPMFLYDTAQLIPDPNNTTRFKSFQKDLQHYLGLEAELTPMIHVSPGKKDLDPQVQAERNARKINICEEQYELHRQHLLKISQQISYWIRTFLIPANTVTISNLDHMEEILESYNHDPCKKNS